MSRYDDLIKHGLLNAGDRRNAGLMGLFDLGSQIGARSAPRFTPAGPPINLSRSMAVYQNALQNSMAQRALVKKLKDQEKFRGLFAPQLVDPNVANSRAQNLVDPIAAIEADTGILSPDDEPGEIYNRMQEKLMPPALERVKREMAVPDVLRGLPENVQRMGPFLHAGAKLGQGEEMFKLAGELAGKQPKAFSPIAKMMADQKAGYPITDRMIRNYANQGRFKTTTIDDKFGNKIPVLFDTHTNKIVEVESGDTGANNIPGPPSTGERSVDKEFAKQVYVPWATKGQRGDALKNNNQLRDAIKILNTRKDISGKWIGLLPNEAARILGFDRAINTKQAVEEVVQRNLRIILGAQFTEKEGERLISRAYDPQAKQEENSRRLIRLLEAMEEAIKAKDASVKYYEKHRTLRGFRGQTPLDALSGALTGRRSNNSTRQQRPISPAELSSARRAIKRNPANYNAVIQKLRKAGVKFNLGDLR